MVHCPRSLALQDSANPARLAAAQAALFAEESQESKVKESRSQEAGKWRKQERDGGSYDLRDESAVP